MIIPLDMWSDLLGLVTSNLGGVPTLIVMAIPFIIGLIVGFFIKKILKIAIIAAIILIIVAYFGLFGLSLNTLGGHFLTYGGAAIAGGLLLFGMLPLGIGFIIGLILGFIFG
jgi:hypothetical protein